MTRLVATLIPVSVDDGLDQVLRAQRAGADLVELRLDRFRDPAEVTELVRLASAPVLASCRVPEDGGLFRGPPELRRALLGAAARAGAEWLDLELWEPMSLPAGARTRVLRSYHRLQGAPRDPEELLRRMLRAGADALKVAWTAYDAADIDRVLDLYALRPEVPLIAFLMGEAGRASRFLALLEGAPFLYCAPGPGEAAAPGQPTLFEAEATYQAGRLGLDGRFWGLVGAPVGHSLGFRLHNGLERFVRDVPLYLPFETEDPERLVRALVRGFGARFLGLSVTAPHKERALRLCDELDADARAAGAVNTLVHRRGRIVGANTDVEGFRLALRRGFEGAPRSGLKALVLGGGGAARAAAVALLKDGAEVAIAARTRARIKDFAQKMRIPLFPLEPRTVKHLRPDVLAHATPVGQHGGDAEGESLLPAAAIPPGCLVLDLVYNPVWTPLLAEARRAGAIPVPGLWMFLHQAILQAGLVLGRPLQVPGLEALARLLGPAGRELRRQPAAEGAGA